MSWASEAVLRVEDLTVRYESVTAVKETTFEVGAGEIVAIIGPNRAGKSSLLSAITAIAPRARGRIEICWRSIDDVPRSDIVRLGAAPVPEGRQIFTSLSVVENLKLGATIRRDGDVELRAPGKAHTLGDQTVHVADCGIVFMGDLAEERMFPIFPWFPPDEVDIDAVNWARVLKTINAETPRIVVPGTARWAAQKSSARSAST